MRTIFILCVFCFAAVQAAWAQVSVKLSLDQNIYVSGEAVIAKVEIVNLSGQTIHLGETADWLKFTMESHDGSYIERLSELDLTSPFDLGPSVNASRSINILPIFDILKSGRYKVTATATIADWGQTVLSNSTIFDVVNGVEVLGFDVGVPSTEQGMPEVRHYAVVRVSYLDKLRLYVRITNQTGDAVFQVVPVCGMVAFSDPKAMIDTKSCLHIINQIHAHRFIYFVMDTSATMLKREFYDYVGTKPILYQNPDGSIGVRGGVRMRTSMDFPPSPVPAQPPSIVTQPGDSVTNAVPDLKSMTKEEKKRFKEEQKRLKAEKRRLEKEEKKRKKAEEDW